MADATKAAPKKAPAAAPATDRPKTECPVTREQFEGAAKPLMIRIGDSAAISVSPKEFSTGSFGWFGNEKAQIEVDGQLVKVQCNMNLIVVGSKEAK